MSAAKRDQSGAFSDHMVGMENLGQAIDAKSVKFNGNGVLFETDHALDQFTELGIQLQLPTQNGVQDLVDGRGVVVDCSKVKEGRFQVSLLLTDLGEEAIDSPLLGDL